MNWPYGQYYCYLRTYAQTAATHHRCIAVEAYGLRKAFGSSQALDGIDLAIPQGSVYGVLGPNGAGKTTAIRILATLLRPDAGTARVLGHVVNVTFSAGDGAAVVNARWVERIDDGPSKYQYHYCSRSAAAAVITPVAGRLPRVKLSRDRDFRAHCEPVRPADQAGLRAGRDRAPDRRSP